MMLRISSGLAIGLFIVSSGFAWSDEAGLPGAGWPVSRYETLWTKSPFAVATPEAGPESEEYSLYGIAQIDGVSYASLTEKKSNEHFLLSTDKPVRGLTLVSITRGGDAAGTLAVVQRNGQSMTLKLEQGPPPQPGINPPGQGAPVANAVPADNPQNVPPGINNLNRPPVQPPPVVRRPRTLHLPPAIQQQAQPQPPSQIPPAPPSQ